MTEPGTDADRSKDSSQPVPNSLAGSYLLPWRRYAVFEGRSGRQEYWTFTLGNMVVAFLLGLGSAFGFGFGLGSVLAPMVLDLFELALIIPSLAVGIRRMHDTDHRGWWILLPVVNLIFTLLPSQPRSNRFGPKRPDQMAGAPAPEIGS